MRAAVRRADEAINRRDFDAVMEFYSEDAVLVVKPGLLAKGKPAIRKAFEAISAYFNHSLVVNQDKLAVIEAGDTALVLGKAVLQARLKEKSDFSMERLATYVFRKEAGAWRCVVDNSYGAELLKS